MSQLQVIAGLADMRREASASATLDTQAQFGERVRLDDPRGVPGPWVKAVLELDGYHGFLPRDALGPVGPEATHKVSVLRTYLYPAANMKSPVRQILSMGARLAASELDISGKGTMRPFAAVEGGFVIADHITPVAAGQSDWVAVAETFTGRALSVGREIQHWSGLLGTAATGAGCGW